MNATKNSVWFMFPLHADNYWSFETQFANELAWIVEQPDILHIAHYFWGEISTKALADFSVRNTKFTILCEAIFPSFYNNSEPNFTKLGNFTSFKMFFLAVVKDFVRLPWMKIYTQRKLCGCPVHLNRYTLKDRESVLIVERSRFT